jgi:pimeloyl-ACP methyl ester carboxylesterase
LAAVNGIKLQYLDWGGKGKTLLFLTGLGDTAHIFDDIAPKFTDHFRVLGLTRRGQGKSDKPEVGYDTNTLVEDIRQFLDAMNIKRVILAGHSLAGNEMTRFAELYPDQVDKLVYLDAAYNREGAAELLAHAPPLPQPSKEELSGFESLRKWCMNYYKPWTEAWEAEFRETSKFSSDGKYLSEGCRGSGANGA